MHSTRWCYSPSDRLGQRYWRVARRSEAHAIPTTLVSSEVLNWQSKRAHSADQRPSGANFVRTSGAIGRTVARCSCCRGRPLARRRSVIARRWRSSVRLTSKTACKQSELRRWSSALGMTRSSHWSSANGCEPFPAHRWSCWRAADTRWRKSTSSAHIYERSSQPEVTRLGHASSVVMQRGEIDRQLRSIESLWRRGSANEHADAGSPCHCESERL